MRETKGTDNEKVLYWEKTHKTSREKTQKSKENTWCKNIDHKDTI